LPQNTCTGVRSGPHLAERDVIEWKERGDVGGI
jgi:hypothetical protein